MTKDYTPTTGEVRATFRSGWTLTREGTSDHDRQVAAQTLRDAADEVESRLVLWVTGHFRPNHRNFYAAWLRKRADSLTPRQDAPGVSDMWVERITEHPCSPPRNRGRDRFAAGSTWRCSCGRTWLYYENWAGDGWTVTDGGA